jgi:hypothetical protein
MLIDHLLLWGGFALAGFALGFGMTYTIIVAGKKRL